MLILLQGQIKGLILLGDAKQLPPTIRIEHSRNKGLAVSLFERLVASQSPSWLLNIQYRMNPAISAWPNRTFYAEKLIDSEHVRSPARRPVWQQEDDSLLAPIILRDVRGYEEFIEASSSYRNLKGAAIILALIQQMMDRFEETQKTGTVSIACLSGYTQQVDLLYRKICSLPNAQWSNSFSQCKRVTLCWTSSRWSSRSPL